MSAVARVKLTIEINVRSNWGDDCQIDQVYRQAEEQALGAVRNGLGLGFIIVGEPEVTAILVKKDGK